LLLSVIQTGADEAHASIRAIARRHRSAQAGTPARAVAAGALSVFWSGKFFLRRISVPFDLELSDSHVFFPVIEIVHATTTPV
jgi:hypothetical protein